MHAGMDLAAARTVLGIHNSVAGMGMIRIVSGPFARVSAIAYVVAPVLFEVVAAAV